MAERKKFWNRVWRYIAEPKADEARLEALVQQIRQELPAPVFWLLGKTQSGKTSIIRALTDNSRAEIGNGLRSCTRTAQMYPFPSEEDCLLRFLDTRGLGEVNYDPSEDIALFADQSHLLIVVMKALDHAQHEVMEALRKIHGQRPDWPVLVVQTCLHEAYTDPEQQHILPYPYQQSPFPPHVPADLARSLQMQRKLFEAAHIEARFVPVDFTLPTDGYEPVNYGLDELWTAIEELLPLGLKGMLARVEEFRKGLRDLRFRAAQPHILSYSLAAGAAAGFPVPMVDVPLVLAVQAKMFHAIASIYQQNLNQQRMSEILSTLGIGYLGRLGGRELLKVVPGLGSAIAALYAAASTYALGVTLCVYFSRLGNGAVPDQSEFQRIYQKHFEEGRSRLRTYLETVRNREPSES